MKKTSRRAAFTLVEIMMVVMIISVLATLSIPAFRRVKRRAITTTVVNDFRTFGAAFDSYAQENGAWPPDSAVGVVPPLMVGRLPDVAFTRKTPMGGKYNWENNQMHFGVRYRAAISINTAAGAPFVLDLPQLQDVEETIDGTLNWLGGTFHIGTGIVPLYIIQD